MPHCDILAYCLMPNHFHLLIHANQRTGRLWRTEEMMNNLNSSQPYLRMTNFSHGVQLLLSSYAKAINRQYNRTGSLFTQNTRSKRTSADTHGMDYTLWCFIYIHNNPVTSGLVGSPEKWPWSSYCEYLGDVSNPICNIELGRKLLDLEENELIDFGSCEVPEHIRAKIF